MLNLAFPKSFMAALVFALALAACAPAAAPPTEVATASPVPSATVTIAPTETATPIPTYTPFVPKGTVKIVSEAPAAQDIDLGANLAVTQLSAELTDVGYDVKFEAFDDQNDVDVALQIAREVIDDPQVLCAVGPYSSRVTINVMELYHRAGLPFISPSATDPRVTARHYLEINRVTGRDDVQGLAALAFAVDKGIASVYIVRAGLDFFDRVANQFKREAGKTDVRVIGDGQSGGFNEGLVKTIAKKIVAAKPDLVFFAGMPNQSGWFFRQVRAAGYEGMLLAAYGDSTLGPSAGPQALEGRGTYYLYASTPVQANPGTQQFARDLYENYHSQPPVYAAAAYDAAGMCIAAIRDATNAKGGELPTRADVAKAIRALQDYRGITGSFSFDQDGDPLLVDYYVMQLTHITQPEWDQNVVAGAYPLPPPN